MVNYEDLIEESILSTLKIKYGFKGDNILYIYLYIKHKLFKDKGRLKTEFNEDIEFMNFIFKELFISELIYKEEKIKIVGVNNNFLNIIDNWKFTYENKEIIDEKENKYSFNDYTEKIISEIIDYSKKQLKGFVGVKGKNNLILYYKLKKLNEIFNIDKINKIPYMEGFKHNEDFELQLSEEEKLQRYYHSVNFNTTSLKTITEEDFENYIYKNLGKIEEGLKPISRQYVIDNGIIDILCIDKNNKTVIIELKITNDKHLIWQVIYYPLMLKKKMNVKDIRVITICPEYPDYLKIPLLELGNIELIKYTANISNSKIRNVIFQKVA